MSRSLLRWLDGVGRFTLICWRKKIFLTLLALKSNTMEEIIRLLADWRFNPSGYHLLIEVGTDKLPYMGALVDVYDTDLIRAFMAKGDRIDIYLASDLNRSDEDQLFTLEKGVWYEYGRDAEYMTFVRPFKGLDDNSPYIYGEEIGCSIEDYDIEGEITPNWKKCI